MVEAQNNHEQIWIKIFGVANVQDPNAELVADYEIKDGKNVGTGLFDVNNPVAVVLKYIYQQESFVYHELNKAARFMDKSKLPTLGPFSKAFGQVIFGS